MGISITTVSSPHTSTALKMFALVQSSEEGEAAAAATHLNRYTIKHNINIGNFKYYVNPPDDYYPVYDRYLRLLTATQQEILTSQEQREQTLQDAKNALDDAFCEFAESKHNLEYGDHLYRAYLNREFETRWSIRRMYNQWIRAYLRNRHVWIRAKRIHAKAAEQVWKRNSDKCPGDGWTWVRTHQRTSRTGTKYTVDGYWRHAKLTGMVG